MKIVIEKNPEKRLTSNERKLRTGKSFAFHESHQPFIKIKVLIKNLETEPEIYVNKIEKKLYKINLLISFLEQLENSRKGKVLLHGAAVANEKKEGFLFCAQQDIGKTTLALLLSRENNFSIIGDDAVILSEDNCIYKVQERIGIFPHPDNFKGINLSFKEKIIAWFKYRFLINPPFCHIHYPNLRISYKKLKRVTKKAKLKEVFILEQGETAIYEIDKKVAIRKILSTTFDLILPSGFVRRLFYSYCFKNNIFPTFMENQYEKILNKIFEGRKIIVLRGNGPFEMHSLFLKYYGAK